MFKTLLNSGRMRGQWFVKCSCGFESTPTYDKVKAENEMSDHINAHHKGEI